MSLFPSFSCLLGCGTLLITFAAAQPCEILVVDAENGWPVPLVELKTNHHVSFFTDNAGTVAFDLPELMGVETWLHVEADGYEVDPDGFGYAGVRLTPKPGGEFQIKIKRTNLAKRLGRLTGGGLFAESQKVGKHLDWQESGILGSDSVQSALYQGKLYWSWGDTIVPRYPLGLFHMPAATSKNPPLESWEPPLKLHLDYFRDGKGRIRNTADVAPDDPGPTWVSGYVSLQDRSGKEHLVGCYSKIEGEMKTYRTGLCVWNDETANFDSVKVIWDKREGGSEPALRPVGHPSFWNDEEGKEWLLFGDPFPSIRMPASYEAWLDSSTWEPLEPPKYLSSADGRELSPHRGSIAWNPYRKRWVTIFGEVKGEPSFLGELWYAEAASPLGPWGAAVKVVSHRQHSFYNPRLHPEFTRADSPILIFEGTYTEMFSGASSHTPRYDYNQILYRLDLDDPLLAPAQTH